MYTILNSWQGPILFRGTLDCRLLIVTFIRFSGKPTPSSMARLFSFLVFSTRQRILCLTKLGKDSLLMLQLSFVAVQFEFPLAFLETLSPEN